MDPARCFLQPHWSLIAPKRPALPTVSDISWSRTPIDRFLLHRLEQSGLHPAPEADRRILARRVFLDLLGLAPPPAEVEQFVNDKAPDAYEKPVDTLLASHRKPERLPGANRRLTSRDLRERRICPRKNEDMLRPVPVRCSPVRRYPRKIFR